MRNFRRRSKYKQTQTINSMKKTPSTQTFREMLDFMKVLKEIIEVTTDWDLKKICEKKLKEIVGGHVFVDE